MKVLVDTNILLDVLAERFPFYACSAKIWTLAELGRIEAFVSSISFNNVYYIVRKAADKRRARQALRLMRDIFVPVATDARIISQAIDSDIDDFEDAVQLYSAASIQADCIITRNVKDFIVRKESFTVLAPDEFLVIYAEKYPDKKEKE